RGIVLTGSAEAEIDRLVPRVLDVAQRRVGVVDLGCRLEVVLPDAGWDDRAREGVVEHEGVAAVRDPRHGVRRQLEAHLKVASLEDPEVRNALRGTARAAVRG